MAFSIKLEDVNKLRILIIPRRINERSNVLPYYKKRV